MTDIAITFTPDGTPVVATISRHRSRGWRPSCTRAPISAERSAESPPRGPAAEHVAHHQAKIAASHMQQDALEDVLVSAQVGSPHLLQW